MTEQGNDKPGRGFDTGERIWLLMVLLVALLVLAQPGWAAEGEEPAEAPVETAEVAEAGEVPAVAAETAAEQPTKLWGGAWYSASARDKLNFASISDWTASQQAGLSFNLRSNSGLEILSDLSVKLDTITENSLDTVIQQLSIRFAPTDWLSLVAGKQRPSTRVNRGPIPWTSARY